MLPFSSITNFSPMDWSKDYITQRIQSKHLCMLPFSSITSSSPMDWSKENVTKRRLSKNLCLYAALLKYQQLLIDGLKQRIYNSKTTLQKSLPLCCPTSSSPMDWIKEYIIQRRHSKNLCLYAALLKHHQPLTDGLKQRIYNSKKTNQKSLPLCCPSQASPAPRWWTVAKNR